MSAMTRPPVLRLHTGELIVDSFAGGGGASLGIEMALGRSPDIAINHDAEAIAMHAANHPATQHYCEDVWKVDPLEATSGKPVGLMWLSPDCKHFSKAKGGKPVEKKIRGLAWIAVKWAKAVKPRVIVLENVEEFQEWGPLTEHGRPCPLRKGFTFRRFVRQLENCGYTVEHRELIAADYGAPTSRKRLFLIARRDGGAICWPQPTHGPGRPHPWRTAAECIDWSLPCPSIFGRKKPLADNTLRRIARGIRKYVINAAQPFIIGAGGPSYSGKPVSVHRPFGTLTAENHRALIIPHILTNTTGHPGTMADAPLRTVTTGGHHALVAAFLAQHNGGFYDGAGRACDAPVSTITQSGAQQQLVTSHIMKMRGTNTGQPNTEPLQTISAQGTHFAEVRAFLVAYYGNDKDGQGLRDPMRTVTAKDRLGLVTVAGEEYAIADIGMRMLAPRELYRAQGFLDSYRIEADANGNLFTKSAQVRMCGNSVSPPIACALIAANFAQRALGEAVA